MRDANGCLMLSVPTLLTRRPSLSRASLVAPRWCIAPHPSPFAFHRQRRYNDCDLPLHVARAVREEAVTIAARAVGAGRHPLHAGFLRLLREERAEVHVTMPDRAPPGELLEHVRSHFVAAAADRGTQ